MQFEISKKILDLFPDAKIGLLKIEGINNREVNDSYTILKEYIDNFKGETNRLKAKRVETWNLLFNRLGIDNKISKPSHVALLERVIKSGNLPDINPIVNLGNLVSLKYTLPIGVHNIQNIKSIFVGETNGDEKFSPIGSNKPEKVTKDEFAYIDPENKKVLTRNLVWRQGDVSKVTEDTNNVVIPLDDIPNNLSYEELESIGHELAALITDLLGGKAKFTIVSKYNSKVDFEQINEFVPKSDKAFQISSKRKDVVTDEKKIDEVLEKGVKDIFPGKDDLKKLMMSGKRLSLYTGIDPTADFIHMGHMIWMKKLRQFQELGHKVIFLIGGFTAMIGDPDKKYSRVPLTKEQVKANFQNYKHFASKILDFDSKENPVEILNNYEWLSQIKLDEWLSIMSNVTLQHILSHDMFRNRLEEQTPIRLHEIIYPLLQGYDCVHMQVDLEVGGSDQTFNMLTGRILSRNILGKEKHVLTMQLLTDNSGKKMGKTTGNSISSKDDPKDVYGKIMSTSDEVLPQLYELLSDKSLEEIRKIQKDIPNKPMEYKKLIAHELTELLHGANIANESQEFFEKTIQNNEIPTDIPEFNITDFSSENIIDIINESKVIASRGEIKRLIKQGGVKVDDKKIDKTDFKVKTGSIIQVGKRNWIKVN